jgi:hypothetical protein
MGGVGSILVNGTMVAPITILTKAAESNQMCKLYYHSAMSVWPWTCSGADAIIDRIDCS